MSAKEYLWDKRGEPDDETRELEALLGQARFSGMKLPAEKNRRWPLVLAGLAAAAVVVFFAVPREGFVRVDGVKLYASQWLETGAGERATVQLGQSIGHVEVEEGSRLRVVRVDEQQQRLELARGSVHAVVLAGDVSVLPLLLGQAAKSDAPTLWHLLSRTEGETRAAIAARLLELIPASVDLARLDARALDEWWTAVLAARG